VLNLLVARPRLADGDNGNASRKTDQWIACLPPQARFAQLRFRVSASERASERPRRPVFEACRCRPLHENAPEHARRGRGCAIIALIRETARGCVASCCAEKSREWRLERIRLVTIRALARYEEAYRLSAGNANPNTR